MCYVWVVDLDVCYCGVMGGVLMVFGMYFLDSEKVDFILYVCVKLD